MRVRIKLNLRKSESESLMRIRTAGGTCQDGVLKATMRCARRHARGHQLQRCRHRVGLLVDLYSVILLPITVTS